MRWTIFVPLLFVVSAAPACITLSAPGKAPVAVAQETAVIVWDPTTRTEHFIRTATFTGNEGPMAFLVPTPSPPRLSARSEFGSDDLAMLELSALIAPHIVTRTRAVYRLSDDWSFDPFPVKTESAAVKRIATGATMYLGDEDDVEVLGQAAIGGYDTAILRASDPKALLRWLKARGFSSDPRLENWLRPYTEKGWAITAFRFRPKSSWYRSDPVCLSFKTDRPFYPYREPATTSAPATRSLRVFLVAPGRQVGQIGEGDWSTSAEFAGPIPARSLAGLSDGFGLPEVAFKGRWLTSFLDKRSTRPDGELYFHPSPDKALVEPTPIVRWQDEPVEIPKGLAATVGGGSLGFVGLLLSRRRRR